MVWRAGEGVHAGHEEARTSSNAYRMPPSGALKAAATPAAAPMLVQSRCAAGMRRPSCMPQRRSARCERLVATIAPMWIIGPSLSSGRPVETMQVTPSTLAISVRIER